MRWFSKPRFAAALMLLLLGAQEPAPSFASSSLNDQEARAHLESMEKFGVLEDPHWAHAYWIRSRSAPNLAARISDLNWALRFAPSFDGARWELCAAQLRARDPAFATQLVEVVARTSRSFAGQQRILLWVVTVSGGTILLTLVVLSTLAIGRSMRYIGHGISERLHFLPVDVRRGATLATILVPLALVVTLPPTAAVFWGMLLGTVAVWVRLERWEKRVTTLTLAAILLAPAGLALWSRVAETAMPGSYLKTLWVTQTVGSPRQIEALETLRPEGADEDPDYQASLALIHRRAGDYERAAELLQRAIELDPGEWSYHNNLGNVRLLQEDVDGALAAYAEARDRAPDEPLVRVNQAQAWVGKLDFRRADEALKEATALGYRIPPLLTSEPTDVIVHDRVLAPRDLWRRFLRGEGQATVLPWSRALAMTIAPLFPLQPFWISLPLFLLIYYVSLTRTLPRASSCAGCGQLVCRKCHYRILRRSLCADCYAIRQEIKAPLKRKSALEKRRKRIGRGGWAFGLVLSILVPGSGHFLRSSSSRGARMVGVTAALALVATAGLLWPDPTSPSSSGLGLRFYVSAGLILILVFRSVRGYLRAEPPPGETPTAPTAPGEPVPIPRGD